jgi:hypothetical protein
MPVETSGDWTLHLESRPVNRLATLIVLVLSLLCQAAAFARPGSAVNLLADAGHAVAHWQDEAHQHDDDGGWHVDDSDEAVGHVMADHCCGMALAHVVPLQWPELAAASPGPHTVATHRPPFLDGPLRPPRTLA